MRDDELKVLQDLDTKVLVKLIDILLNTSIAIENENSGERKQAVPASGLGDRYLCSRFGRGSHQATGDRHHDHHHGVYHHHDGGHHHLGGHHQLSR